MHDGEKQHERSVTSPVYVTRCVNPTPDASDAPDAFDTPNAWDGQQRDFREALIIMIDVRLARYPKHGLYVCRKDRREIYNVAYDVVTAVALGKEKKQRKSTSRLSHST